VFDDIWTSVDLHNLCTQLESLTAKDFGRGDALYVLKHAIRILMHLPYEYCLRLGYVYYINYIALKLAKFPDHRKYFYKQEKHVLIVQALIKQLHDSNCEHIGHGIEHCNDKCEEIRNRNTLRGIIGLLSLFAQPQPYMPCSDMPYIIDSAKCLTVMVDFERLCAVSIRLRLSPVLEVISYEEYKELAGSFHIPNAKYTLATNTQVAYLHTTNGIHNAIEESRDIKIVGHPSKYSDAFTTSSCGCINGFHNNTHLYMIDEFQVKPQLPLETLSNVSASSAPSPVTIPDCNRGTTPISPHVTDQASLPSSLPQAHAMSSITTQSNVGKNHQSSSPSSPPQAMLPSTTTQSNFGKYEQPSSHSTSLSLSLHPSMSLQLKNSQLPSSLSLPSSMSSQLPTSLNSQLSSSSSSSPPSLTEPVPNHTVTNFESTSDDSETKPVSSEFFNLYSDYEYADLVAYNMRRFAKYHKKR
jgi:hypothetical protein